jgi:hypothetical protein
VCVCVCVEVWRCGGVCVCVRECVEVEADIVYLTTCPPFYYAARTEWAVDVLVHPWVMRACDRHPSFAMEFSAFVAQCAPEELGLTLQRRMPGAGAGGLETVERLTHVEYVGGNPAPGGKGGAEVPADFDVTAYMRQANGGGQQTVSAPKAAPTIVEVGGAAAAAPHAAPASAAPAPAPQDLKLLGDLKLPGQPRPGGGSGSAAAAASAVKTPAPADLLREIRWKESGSGKRSTPVIQAARPEGEASIAEAAASPKAEQPPGPSAAVAAPAVAGIKASPVQSVRVVQGSDGAVTATVEFDPDVVDVTALRMKYVELDIEPDALVLVVLPAALQIRTAASAAVDPVVRVRLPCYVDAETAEASYSRANRTLTVVAQPGLGGALPA